MRSEQIAQLNKALKYCDQLKNNLEATLLHVQMLNWKYNSQEPVIKLNDTYNGIGYTSTPKMIQKSMASPMLYHRRRLECHPTPDKLNRSLQEIKQCNNTIIVRGIKVRRDVETVVNQLKRIRENHRKEKLLAGKRRSSLLNNSELTTSLTKCGHQQCFDVESPIGFGSNQPFSTPINRRRLFENNRFHSPKTC